VLFGAFGFSPPPHAPAFRPACKQRAQWRVFSWASLR
jgi:hypothetical protein